MTVSRLAVDFRGGEVADGSEQPSASGHTRIGEVGVAGGIGDDEPAQSVEAVSTPAIVLHHPEARYINAR